MTFRLGGICMDCADVEAMARFYGDLFGWEITGRDTPESRLGGTGWICMSGPEGGPSVSFQAESWYVPPTWPEDLGQQTKMMHLEVAVDDVEAAVELVLRAGGRVAPSQPADRDTTTLRIMLDPAGHPFCLCG
ncbi:MAG TPA: VOC family protein [Acidimicrobiales bacterium]|nr:VOC family protein [Acidimicrobiales bacterium]